MPDNNDMDLLQEFARHNSEAAFAELVRRHINLVYSVALRYTASPGDAEDVAQAVFIILARKAARLSDRTVLTGWLYETTRLTAAGWLRTQKRRLAHELEAYMQSTLDQAGTDNLWRQLAPHLEAAMSRLGERDRALLALRFYENKTGAEAAALLGIRAEAAHKRTARALEKLRQSFVKCGVSSTAAMLAGAISANSVQAAPAGLAATISAAATNIAGTAVTTTIIMTTLQKIAVTAALTVTIGAGAYAIKQAHDARAEAQKLQAQQAPLAEQVQQLQAERDKATNQIAWLNEELARNEKNNLELLKLRGEIGVLRQQADDANHKALISEQKLAETLSYKAQFAKEESKTVSDIKVLRLAMCMYASDNNGIFTNDLVKMTNYLGYSFEEIRQTSSAFDYINVGAVKFNTKDGTIIGPGNMVQLRERMARQAPDGTWHRTYVLADGSTIVADTIDGNFDAWEKANTYIPPTNQ